MPVSGMPVSKRSLQAAGGDSGSPAGPAQEWAADVGAAAAAPRPQDEQQPPPAEHGPQFKQPDRLETQPGQCTEAGSSEVPEGCSRLQPTPASMRCGSAMSVGTPGSLADRPPRELSLQLDGQQPAPLAALLHTVLLKKEGERHRLEDDFTLGPAIGQGAYATVRLLEDWHTGKLFACKTISKARLLCKEDIEDVEREAEILHLLGGHPNIAALRATYEDRRAVHLVMEYCSGGELFGRIVSRGTFSEAEAARYFRQMVEVVHHCHSLGVIHRDIKLENFLLTDETDGATIKACDFGLSTYFHPGQVFTERVGSSYYLAPEVLARRHSHQCDMWSLGVVLYILLSGMPPFRGTTNAEVFEMIEDGVVDFDDAPWPFISTDAKDVVRRLLTPDPAHRITAAQLLQHPWLRANGASDRPLDSMVISRLRAFATASKLKQAAVLAAAKHLSIEQMEGLRHLFESFDTDGDGVISLAELREGLQQLDRAASISETELTQVMREMDVDGSGSVDYHEFIAATIHQGLLLQEEVLIDAFNDLDTDGSGYLSVDEVAAAIGRVGDMAAADIRAAIEQHDTNRDGVIDYTEFVAMLRGKDSELRRLATLRFKAAPITY